MKPDDDEPAGKEPGSDEPEDIDLPRVPRPPDLPPPPEIEYRRPRLRGPEIHPEHAPTGMTYDQAKGGAGDLSSVGRIGAGLSIGVTFTTSILVGFGAGMLIDRHWPGVSPWGTVLLGLAGIAAGFLNLYRLMAAILPRDKSK